jgi:COP9 signalosome complex subunit 6
MLSRRISLLRAYLSSLPPSYLSDASLPFDTPSSPDQSLPLNHSILRSISAMLSRINILAPPDSEAFTLESQQEASDVQLIALLSSITNSVSTAKELGRKSHLVEHAKQQGRKGGIGGMMSGGSGYDAPGGSQYYEGDVVMGPSGGRREFGGSRWQ